MNKKSTGRRSITGAALLEVLISALILGIGLLGVVMAQAISLKNSRSAMQRSQAVVLNYTILDAMRLNASAAAGGAYDLAPGAGCDPGAVPGKAGADLIAWIGDIRETVDADACGSVDCEGRLCTVAVRWDDTLASGGLNTQEVTSRGRL